MARNNDRPTAADIQKARELAEELRNRFPTEFTLSARLARNGETQYPALHFRADPDVPGLFYADVDPDFIMGRIKEPVGIQVANPTLDGESET